MRYEKMWHDLKQKLASEEDVKTISKMLEVEFEEVKVKYTPKDNRIGFIKE